jgi:CBS domain-containing protein
MSAPAERASPEEPLSDAAARMNVKRLGCLPVISAGSLVGILTRSDVLAFVAQMPVSPAPGLESVVSDYMTHAVAAVHADTPVADAAATMVLLGIRHLPVVDTLNRVIGMLSDRDVRTGVGDLKKLLEEAGGTELRVEHVMASEPRTVAPDAPLTEAVDAFLDDRFGALPVVDEGDQLVGVISYVDVLAALSGRQRRG